MNLLKRKRPEGPLFGVGEGGAYMSLGEGDLSYAKLEDWHIVLTGKAVIRECGLTRCQVLVEDDSRLIQCYLDDCKTLVGKGAFAPGNFVNGGSYTDLNTSPEPLSPGTFVENGTVVVKP